MKTKFIIIFFLLGICSHFPAQGQHTYKPTQCMLGGKPLSWGVDVNRCPVCLEIVKKEEAAKAKEDQRVKDIAIKKAEEAKQKAIAESKRQNEAIAAKRKADRENVVHIGVPKQTKVTEVKKEKIITDERYRLKANKKDEKWGFDDANGEPVFYSEDYVKTETYQSANSYHIKYPKGYGVAFFKNGNVDIVDFKGNRLLNDSKITQIYHVINNWFILTYDYKPGVYSANKYFSELKLFNIKTKESMALPGGYIESKRDYIEYFSIMYYNDYDSNIKENTKYYSKLLWISEMLGVGIQDWKVIIRYRTMDKSDYINYYLDINDKVLKPKIHKNWYEEATKVQKQTGNYPSW